MDAGGRLLSGGTAADAADGRAGGPAGVVDQAGAAERVGVSARQLREMTHDGRIDYGGVLWLRPGRRKQWVRVYDVAELDASVARMHARQAERERAGLPDGFVDRAEAARRLNISPDTLALWHTNGRLSTGRWWKQPNGRAGKIYSVTDIEALRAKLAERPALSDGYIDVDEACRLFGVTRAAFIIWKRAGKVPRGTKHPNRFRGLCRIYARDELLRVREAMRGQDCVYQMGGTRGCRHHIPDGWVQLREACRILGVHANTFVRWEREGVIACGKNETGRRIKIYPRAELDKIVAEHGRYAPPYPDPDRPGCWRVPLAGESISRREAVIDAADLPVVEGRRFHFSAKSDENETIGCVATFDRDNDEMQVLHRLILGVTDRATVVGHRNDDPLDCRRENLVIRTRTESAANKRKQKTICGRPTSSQFKGVCREKRSGRWVVHIKQYGKSMSLGRYDDELAAAERYDAAAQDLFGEHARLNFPDGVDAWLEQQHAPERVAA